MFSIRLVIERRACSNFEDCKLTVKNGVEGKNDTIFYGAKCNSHI